jgi:hypothetical protein
MKREFPGSSYQPLTGERPKGRAQWVVVPVVAIGLLIVVAWAMRSLTSASPLLCRSVFPDGTRLDVMGVSMGERIVDQAHRCPLLVSSAKQIAIYRNRL